MELTRCALFRQPSATERLLVADGAEARCGRSGSPLRTERLLVADGQHAHRGRMRRKSRTDEVLVADGRDLTHTNSFPFVLQIHFFSLILQRI